MRSLRVPSWRPMCTACTAGVFSTAAPPHCAARLGRSQFRAAARPPSAAVDKKGEVGPGEKSCLELPVLSAHKVGAARTAAGA